MRPLSSILNLPVMALGLTLWALSAGGQERVTLSDIVEAWLASPHGDHRSESFTHWNKAGEVPVNCAACHSEPGFIDFLGADGSAAGSVNSPAPIQSPIGCAACHTGAAHDLDSVTFPSGVTMDRLGASATCMVCHQGRQSSDSVAAATAGIGDDAVSKNLSFVNIHYGAAAATLMGSNARGGYQYPGKRYAGRFTHVPSADTCVDCHRPHTTRVETEGCLSCHREINSLREIRTMHGDFDGDGDRAEGIHGEIGTLHRRLGAAIKTYAMEVSGAPIVYHSDRHPYFFTDSDEDGTASEAEAVNTNRYRNWTPRLLRAAYNYQFVAKDPGGYAHNPTYILQLLYDSLESLSGRVDVGTDPMSRP